MKNLPIISLSLVVALQITACISKNQETNTKENLPSTHTMTVEVNTDTKHKSKGDTTTFINADEEDNGSTTVDQIAKDTGSQKETMISQVLESTHVPLKAETPVKKAKIVFEKSVFDMGELVEGEKRAFKFEFENVGDAPLSIASARATCGCTIPSYPFIDIMPGEKGYIGVEYHSVGKEGPQTPEITITSNASQPSYKLYLKAVVVPKGQGKRDTL